jgi:sterol desaturase/sphingolipid hydroxylase (fatty acid hydroxylase superfamily)
MPSAELWTFGAVVAAGIVFMGLERLAPYNPSQKPLRAGFWNDLLLYGALQSYVLGMVISRLVAWFDAHSGISRLHLVSGWGIAWQLLFFIVTHDFYTYLFHRWEHRSPTLWRLHEAHHSVKDVDWLSGVRSHSLEILINQTIEFAPLVLLGAAPVVFVLKGAVSAVWGMFIHGNLDIRLGPLRFLINGPEMHRWHHADDPRAYNRNFATKLSAWDWMFGTAFVPDAPEEKATRYGLADRQYPEHFPLGYFLQQAFPFVRGRAAASAAPDSAVAEP